MTAGGRYVSGILRVSQQKVDTAIYMLAVFSLAGRVTTGHKCQPRQADDGHSAAVPAAAKGTRRWTVFQLLVCQIDKALVDRLLCGRSDEFRPGGPVFLAGFGCRQ